MTNSTTAIELLQQLPIFTGLAAVALSPLAEQARLDHFDREATVFYQGDDCDRVWIVRAGRVKIVYHETDGREVILEVIAPGELFGGAVLFMPRHPATAKAMEETTETISFSSAVYAHFLTSQPGVTLKLIRMLGGRLHSMMGLQILAGERVERRLAHILIKLGDRTGRADPEGTLITVPLSRQDLADMAGTTLETAIRTMSRFRSQGLLETKPGGYLLIKDLERLHHQAEPT